METERILDIIHIGSQRHAWFFRDEIVLCYEEADHVCWVCGKTETGTPLETCPDCRRQLANE